MVLSFYQICLDYTYCIFAMHSLTKIMLNCFLINIKNLLKMFNFKYMILNGRRGTQLSPFLLSPVLPTIQHGQQILSTIEGIPVTLPCRASGIPKPSITWSKVNHSSSGTSWNTVRGMTCRVTSGGFSRTVREWDPRGQEVKSVLPWTGFLWG